MDRTVCVHVASPAGEAEFRFPGAAYRIQDGALIVVDAQGGDLMALSAGLWRAAWIADAHGKPAGLSGPLAATALPGAATPSATQAPKAEPKPQASPAPAKPDHAPAILAALAQGPYVGLADLASRTGLPAEELERAVSAALGRAIDADSVALEPIQARLQTLMPDIMASSPQNLSQILTQLKEKDPEAGFDLIQLRVWIRRNPGKRQS